MTIAASPSDPAPVVITVREPELAISLEIFIQALGRSTVIHDPDRGLSSLPLTTHSTLIVDRQLVPGDPAVFLRRLRGQLWIGHAILLVEDGAAPDHPFGLDVDVAVIEKPFVTRQLMDAIDRAHVAR